MQPKIQTITDPKRIKALVSEKRVKILQTIAAEPKSISQLARQFGISPVAVYYHIKKLEEAGFVKVARTSVVNNNFTEKFYQVATEAYLVVLGVDLPLKGPVPPKNQGNKQILGVGRDEIKATFEKLGLKCKPEDEEQLESNVLKLLEMAMQEAEGAYKEILNQLMLKLSPADRSKIESAAKAVIPIVLDRIVDKQQSLETLRATIQLMNKKSAVPP